MKNYYTVFVLVGLVFVIIVADVVDRWALSYPLTGAIVVVNKSLAT